MGALILVFSGLSGCQNAGTEDMFGKGWLAPQELMRLTHNQLPLPILDKLSGLDEPNEEFALSRAVIADDLKVESADYVIGKNDLLSISLTEVTPGAETVKTTRVSESGNIVLPLIGQVPAAGYTEAKLTEAIVEKYKVSFIVKDAQVSVTVIEARNRTFQIRGAVQRPGQYQIIQTDFRILDALVLAGDITLPTSQAEFLYVIRPPAKTATTQPTTLPSSPLIPGPATIPVKPEDNGGGLLDPKPKVDRGLIPAEKTEPVPTTPKPDTRTDGGGGAQRLNNLPAARTPQARRIPFGSKPVANMPNLDDLSPVPAGNVQKSDGPKRDGTNSPTTKPAKVDQNADPETLDIPKLVELPAVGTDAGPPKSTGAKSDTPKLDDVPPATLEDINKKPADKAAADKAAADKAAADKAVADKAAADKAALDKPAADKPAADKPGAEKPVMDDKPAPVFVNGGQPLDPKPDKPGDVDVTGADKSKDYQFNSPLPEDQSTIIKVPLRSLLQGDLKYNIVVKPQDTIMLPQPEAGEFYMGGHVARVGVYSLTGRQITLKQAIISAGMLDEVAIPERTDIIRRVGREREVFVRVNLVKVFEGKQPDLFLKPYDIVMVGTNAAAPFIAALRNSFRITYGLGFLYDRNYYVDNSQNSTNNGGNRRTR